MSIEIVRGKYVLVRAQPNGNSEILENGAVAHQDGVIIESGSYPALHEKYPDSQVFGNGRQFLLPGLVNAHHHGRGVSSLQMGQSDGCLETWIHRGRGRRPLDPYLMGLYTVMQHLRSGTTTVMYNQTPGPAAGIMDEAIASVQAFRKLGARIAFSVGYRNQCLLVYGDDERFLRTIPSPVAAQARSIVDELRLSTDDYLSLHDDLTRQFPLSSNNDFRLLLSPANYHWCDERTHERISEYATTKGLGMHTHLVETLYQRQYSERLHGQTPARRLYELGALGSKVSLAHGVWLTNHDLDLLAETGTGVCHNPSSNLRLHSGIAPITEMLQRDITLALGTDSTGINDDDDMFQEMGLAFALHRPPGLTEQSINPHQLLHMATIGGAKVTTFGDDIGSLEVGRQADMVLLDWEEITFPYVDEDLDLLEILVSRARGKDVQTVFVGGRVVYQDGVYPGIDREVVTKEIERQLGQTMPASVRERRGIYTSLEPYLRSFYQGWEFDTTSSYQYHSTS